MSEGSCRANRTQSTFPAVGGELALEEEPAGVPPARVEKVLAGKGWSAPLSGIPRQD
jgi:hypothetical protein